MFAAIKGAGDLASGIALRLHRSGFFLAMTEIPSPLAVRRTVSFSEAVYKGRAQVEEVSALLVKDSDELKAAWHSKDAENHNGRPANIGVFVDPGFDIVKRLRPDILVDAIMAKRNTGTSITDAPLVIGIGPGFTAGIDCHAVIETQRGHNLGRVIWEGSAFPNTGIPGGIDGYSTERLLRCPIDGVFEALASIGDVVKKGDIVALVRPAVPINPGENSVPEPSFRAEDSLPLKAGIDGVLRGLLPSGITVRRGMKAGDIDPRCECAHCFTVSDKALAVGGGVLEAVLSFSSIIQGGFQRNS